MGRRSQIDKKEAVRLYAEEKWRIDALAARYGVSTSAVRQFLRRMGVPLRVDIRADCKVDPVGAERMRIKERMSIAEIAEHFGASSPAVCLALRRRRGDKPAPRHHDRAPMAILLAHGARQIDVAGRLGMTRTGIVNRLGRMGTSVRQLRRDLLPLTHKQLAAYAEAIDGRVRLDHADALDLARDH